MEFCKAHRLLIGGTVRDRWDRDTRDTLLIGTVGDTRAVVPKSGVPR